MYQLAEQKGSSSGPYCGPEGLFLGGGTLIDRRGGIYQLRRTHEIAALLAAAYGDHAADAASRLPGLCTVAVALQEGDIVRAMIAGLHLRLGEISPEGLARMAQAETLLKANFNPAEPRDWHGRWTTNGDAGPGTTHEPAIEPAQELLPFAARPPLFFDDPPETIRPFKEPIPHLSGAEGAKNAPSWARGNRPFVGEKGRDFAKRLMDDKYGPGNWDTKGNEYRQIQKWGDRSFRDPRSILLPDDDQI